MHRCLETKVDGPCFSPTTEDCIECSLSKDIIAYMIMIITIKYQGFPQGFVVKAATLTINTSHLDYVPRKDKYFEFIFPIIPIMYHMKLRNVIQ